MTNSLVNPKNMKKLFNPWNLIDNILVLMAKQFDNQQTTIEKNPHVWAYFSASVLKHMNLQEIGLIYGKSHVFHTYLGVTLVTIKLPFKSFSQLKSFMYPILISCSLSAKNNQSIVLPFKFPSSVPFLPKLFFDFNTVPSHYKFVFPNVG